MKYYYQSTESLIRKFLIAINDNENDIEKSQAYLSILIEFLNCFLKLKDWKGTITISEETLVTVKNAGIPSSIYQKLLKLQI